LVLGEVAEAGVEHEAGKALTAQDAAVQYSR